MGRNRVSNDADFVQPNQYVVPPNLKPLPHFEPLHIKSPYINKAPNLLPNINPIDPYTLFRLIFTKELLKEFIIYINKYIKPYLIIKIYIIKIRL